MFLITGGYNGHLLESTEVYDPSVGSWTVIGARLPRPMDRMKATFIKERVLIFGKGSINFKKLWGGVSDANSIIQY